MQLKRENGSNSSNQFVIQFRTRCLTNSAKNQITTQ